MILRSTAIAAFLAIAACAPVDTLTQESAQELAQDTSLDQQVVVTRVIDGDTVVVQAVEGAEVKVRILSIDAPEMRGDECYADEATQFAEETLLGQSVTLVADSAAGDVDRYGRQLRYIELGSGEDFSELAVDAGVARSYIYDKRRPPARTAQIQAAEDRARAAGAGLWSACPVFPTP